MTIGGHLRRYAMKLFPGSAFFSSSSSRPQARPPLLNSRPQIRPPRRITPSEVAAWVVFGVVYNVSLNWLGSHARNMCELRNAEKAMQKRLEELDRKKEESPEAYLEMLHEVEVVDTAPVPQG